MVSRDSPVLASPCQWRQVWYGDKFSWLPMIFSEFLLKVAVIKTSSLYCWVIFHCMNTLVYSSLTNKWTLPYFCFPSWLLQAALLQPFKYKAVCRHVFSLFCGLLSPMVTPQSASWEISWSFKVTLLLEISTNSMRFQLFLHLFCCCCWFGYSHPSGCQGASWGGYFFWICICQITGDVFISSLDYWPHAYLFGEFYILILFPFLTWAFVILFSHNLFMCSEDSRFRVWICHSRNCLASVLMVSFARYEFLILMSSHFCFATCVQYL